MIDVDPAEHAADQLFVIDVAVGHVDHGFVDAGQAVDEDLGGVLDVLDVRAMAVRVEDDLAALAKKGERYKEVDGGYTKAQVDVKAGDLTVSGQSPMPDGEIALELAEFRRALEVGLARIDGQLALLVQRYDQIDKAVEELDARVTALERTRWPLPTISTLTGLAALGVALWSAAGR
ncbi:MULTISPECIES: hypothetical protein [unclassified Streptomyces]|uniref:hypothetical protein n=1 Tax=unclassified Streptomyces TaxID=2593676 RepID=UPI0033B6E4A4